MSGDKKPRKQAVEDEHGDHAALAHLKLTATKPCAAYCTFCGLFVFFFVLFIIMCASTRVPVALLVIRNSNSAKLRARWTVSWLSERTLS